MSTRIAKILSIVSFIFIAIALYIIAITPPATGYEISIYDAYPLYFWFFIITSIACGICTIVYQAFTGNKSRWWLVGFSTIIFANLIVLLLPVFRGYEFYAGGDGLAHLGMVEDIISTGKLGEYNFYPGSHTLTTIILYITGLSLKLVVAIMPAIFYILYIIGIYLLATVVAKTAGQLILITALGTPLLFGYFHTSFLPTYFSLCPIPLLLFLFYKAHLLPGNVIQYRIPFLLTLFVVPFLHPFGSMMLVFTFIVFGVSLKIHSLLLAHDRGNTQEVFKRSSLEITLIPVSLTFITFFIWFSSFAAFRSSIKVCYDWLMYGIGASPIAIYQTWGQELHMTILEFAHLLFNTYGHNLLYSLLAAIAILAIIKKKRDFGGSSIHLEEIFFSLLFITFALVFLPFLFAVTPVLQPMREFKWALMASIFLNGVVFHEWIFTKWRSGKRERRGPFKENVVICVMIMLILFSSIIGIFSTHSSPIIGSPSHHVTYMHWAGMEWFFKYRNPALETYYLGGDIAWECAIFGYQAALSERRLFKIPSHLGYDSEETLEDLYNSGAYIVIGESGRVPHEELWPNVIFSKSDFKRLSSDPMVRRLYTNSGVEISQYSLKTKGHNND